MSIFFVFFTVVWSVVKLFKPILACWLVSD